MNAAAQAVRAGSNAVDAAYNQCMENGDMNEDDKPERKVIKLVQRSMVKTVAGRQMRFVEPGAGVEAGLHETFRTGDVSAYGSELIAV